MFEKRGTVSPLNQHYELLFVLWLRKKYYSYSNAIPFGAVNSLINDSCSGSLRRISAATGSGWTAWRSLDILCDRIKFATDGLDVPFSTLAFPLRSPSCSKWVHKLRKKKGFYCLLPYQIEVKNISVEDNWWFITATKLV